MKLRRFTALVVSIIMVVCCFPFGLLSASAEGYTLDYTFIGDEADLAGFGQGLITVTPDSSGATSGYYLVYYTDGTNVLTNYDEVAYAKITGEPVRMEIKDGAMIPQGAKGIAVFESQTKYLDNAPNISSAKAKCPIPAYKQLTLSSPEFVFGLASDVHMNYEGTGAGAYSKWANALSFFKKNNASHVVISGDMTGDASDATNLGADFTLEKQYQKYMELVTAAGYTKDNVIECLGNHSNTTADRGLFTTYVTGASEVHPFAGSGYFYVLLKGQNGAKDNLFIALQQELDGAASGYKANQSANVDNFSKAQMDWFEGLLKTYGNDANTNVFVLCHSPFRNYGAGEKYEGTYTALTTFKSEYPQNMRLKELLETYKGVTVFSGHTHQTLYDALNYSNMAGTFAHTVHAPSPTAPRGYKEDGSFSSYYDGRKSASPTYGSEAYLVKVYKDYVVYTGYNLSTNKIIPAGCLIIPTSPSVTPSPDQAFEGSGTKDDPYLIQNESDFLVFTNGMNQSTNENAKYGDGKYFKQTADINMMGIESYLGTHANGGAYAGGMARFYFGGHYDGNGYTIRVTIKGPEQRSVFPYVYGTICNVVIRGDIVSDDAAQPIRANRGSIINCVFDCYLRGKLANGITYSNYSYVYNVYTSGMLNGTSNNPVASNNDTNAQCVNVFHHYINTSSEAVTASTGVRTNDYAAVCEAMNLRSGTEYNTAASKASPAVMSKAGVVLGQLRLGHDGNGPVAENMPTSGNIANYGYYTLSPLFRMGGADVNWGWDETKPVAYPDETGKTLTDGKLPTALGYGDAAWVGFHENTPDYISKGYHSITFKFGEQVNIKAVNIYVGTTDVGSGVTAPDKIDAYCDGTLKTSVVPTDKATDNSVGVEKVVINLNSKAKELELRLKNVKWAFVSEVEIITYVPDDHKCAGAGDWQSDANGHWKNCSCGKKTDEASHDSGSWVTVTEPKLGVKGKQELRCTTCGYAIDVLESTAIGDLSGDGQISATDYLRLKKACFGTYAVDDMTIADVNGNGRIDATDYFMLKRYVFTH